MGFHHVGKTSYECIFSPPLPRGWPDPKFQPFNHHEVGFSGDQPHPETIWGPPCSPYLPVSPHSHTSVYSYLTSNSQPVFLCPMAFSPWRWLCSLGSRQEVTGFTPLVDAHTSREAKQFSGISHIE